MWFCHGTNSPGVDYAADSSASLFLNAPGAYTFTSTARLVADVQAWVDDPLANHGWILISRSEGVPGTSRRFASREDAVLAPSLTISFTPPPVFRIMEVTLGGGVLNLTWADGLGPYQIQFRPSLQEPWANWGMPTLETFGSVPLNGSQGYVRIVAEQTARYRLTFTANWTSSTHPDQYPAGPHFSGLVGATHRGDAVFWRTNQPASIGIKNVAELGSKTALISEVESAISSGQAGQVLSGAGIGSGTGSVALDFTVSRDYPLVTVVSMLAPSPDWFVGVEALELLDEEARWRDGINVPLYLYDAGTDSGPSYASPNQITAPFENIRLIEGFPALVGEELVPFGTFTFERMP